MSTRTTFASCSRLALLLATLPLAACSARLTTGHGSPTTDGGATDAAPFSTCAVGMHQCVGNAYETCVGGAWQKEMDCPLTCVAALGCVACHPSVNYCEGDTVHACHADGTAGDPLATCAQGMCVAGDCADACGHAALASSYLGCEYFPTVTANNQLLEAAHFAVAVANPGMDAVGVAVVGPNGVAMNVSVPPGQLQTVELPWVDALKNATASALVAGGAYHLATTLPVTVYQFNPLEFQVTDGCDPNTDIGGCYTFTNDASLLLPTTTLTTHYIAISRPTFLVQDIEKDLFSTNVSYPAQSPGFIAVVASDPGTTMVSMKFTAPTQPGANIGAYAAGQTGTFTLSQGDVLQIFSQIPGSCNPQETEKVSSDLFSSSSYGYCDLPNLDLTGTEITSDKRVAVYSGHNCTFIPFDKWACDHVEEEMLPLEGWGKHYHGVKITRTPSSIPDLFRVVSGADNNSITFDPAVHAPVTLNRGQWMEFTSTQDFDVKGTVALALAQFMVGQDYNGFNSGGNNPGDPAMSLAVPVEQYRSSYIFLAPASYTLNYVNVSAPVGVPVMLDGAPIDMGKFAPIGMSGYAGARVAIAAGTHTITSAQPFGISVYGLAPYTSYMYPGGLDIKQINDPGIQ